MAENAFQPPHLEMSPIGPSRHLETTGRPAPELRFIRKTLMLLKPEMHPDGTTLRWQDLYTRVEPWQSSHQLTDNVRSVVLDWVANKVPALKNGATSLRDLSDESVVKALGHGWFEELKTEGGEDIDISGQRREVLLATMAHAVRKIETGVFMNILHSATPEQLQKLSLDPSTRDLTVELMKTSLRADPLFIRFMAYAGMSGQPSNTASPEGLTLPSDDLPHSFRELFPKETKSIGTRFGQLADQGGSWTSMPGGETFKRYLEVSSKYYLEDNPERATQLRQEWYDLYREYISEGFPVVLTGPTDESVKPPYIDPELKVSLRSEDARADEEKWKQMQEGFAQSLSGLGLQDQAQSVRDQLVVGSMVLGGYGVNLNFDAVAQEDPTIQIYLNAQARSYDREFPKEVLERFIHEAEATFGGLTTTEGRVLAEFIPRTSTVMHELGHWVYPGGSPEDQRFGDGDVNRSMQEIKAESLYRALIPAMIDRGVLQGTREQWAQGLVGNSIQLLRDGASDENDDYFRGAALTMNDAFSSGSIQIENGRVVIVNTDAFFDSVGNVARDVLGQYQNVSSNERSARTWIKSHCTPSEETRKLIELITKS